MEERKPPGRVQDYTDAFLVSFGVLLFIALFAVMAAFGWLWTAAAAFGIDRAITGLQRHRA